MNFNHAVFWTDERTAKHQDSVEVLEEAGSSTTRSRIPTETAVATDIGDQCSKFIDSSAFAARCSMWTCCVVRPCLLSRWDLSLCCLQWLGRLVCYGTRRSLPVEKQPGLRMIDVCI